MYSNSTMFRVKRNRRDHLTTNPLFFQKKEKIIGLNVDSGRANLPVPPNARTKFGDCKE
jgi:hypothetical protein